MRETVIQWAYEHKIVAIVRGIEPEKCLKVAEALYEGGIRMMEITYDQKNPAGWAETAQTIGKLVKAMEGKMLIGAGTVTTVELVELTHKAGGLFIISPNTNTDVIRRTRELGMVSMPGALTPTAVVAAYEAGADIVKLFPISTFGPGYLKAIKAPLSHIPMMAVAVSMRRLRLSTWQPVPSAWESAAIWPTRPGSMPVNTIRSLRLQQPWWLPPSKVCTPARCPNRIKTRKR